MICVDLLVLRASLLLPLAQQMPNKSKTNKKKSKGNLAKRSNAANKVRDLSKAGINSLIHASRLSLR
eukprot:21256-Heterococcus_DN1.PRE.6